MMRSKQNLKLIWIAVISICFILSGCTQHIPAYSNQTILEEENNNKDEDEHRRIFAIVYPVAHPFFEGVTRSAKDMAEALHVELVIHAPDNVEQQIQIMNSLIAMKVDGIGIGPTDPEALTPIINKAVEAGIKVICFDTDAPESKRLSYIGTNNYLAGQHLGEVVAKLINYEGTIIGSTGISTMLNLNTRIDGLQKILNKYPKIELLDIRSSDGTPAETLKNIEEMIDTHPHFDALVGFDSLAGSAAITVWKALGLEQVIVAFDDLPTILDGVSNGQISSTISQQQFMWGELIIQRLNEAADGYYIPLFEDTKTVEINLDNLALYRNGASAEEDDI